MAEEKSIREEIGELKDIIQEGGKPKKKTKPFRIPWGARVGNNKLKKGYITIAIIQDNMSVNFKKEPIIDGTIKLHDTYDTYDTYHAVEDFDIFNYKGKPFIFQAKSKLNPYNPLKGDHETYGQKYIMARMEGERIIAKRQIGWGMSIGLLIIVGVVIYALITGGGG